MQKYRPKRTASNRQYFGLCSRTVTSPRQVRRYMIAPAHGSSRTMSAKHTSAPFRVKYGIAGECCDIGPTAYRKNGMIAATRTKAEPDGGPYSLPLNGHLLVL